MIFLNLSLDLSKDVFFETKMMNKNVAIKLSEILQETTGVSLLPLNNAEITSKIIGLVHFPNYIYKTIITPVLVLLALTLVVTIGFCFAGEFFLGLIFFTLGTFVAIAGGILIGIIYFNKRLAKEIGLIFMEILRQVRLLLLEIGVADEDMIDGYMEIPPLADVIKASTYMIAIENIEKEANKRLPYGAHLVYETVMRLFNSLFNNMDSYLNKMQSMKNHAHHPRATGISSSLQAYSQNGITHIDRLMRDSKSLTNRTINWVNIPLKIILTTMLGIAGLVFTLVVLLID